MKKYVESTLHVEIQQKEFQSALPLYLKGKYDLEKWQIKGQSVLVAYPKVDVGVVALEKHQSKLEHMFEMPVVFAFETTTRYKIKKMTEKGIAFILNGRQVFMPFFGIVMSESNVRDLPEIEKVSIQTQKFILLAIYHRWTIVDMVEASQQLDVSRMTASRVFDELEGIDPNLISKEGKYRQFYQDMELKRFWKRVQPFLFNPVIREYRLEQELYDPVLKLSGISALSRYTMINDNNYPTFSLTREGEKWFRLKERFQVPKWESPGCIVQIVKYKLDEKDVMDPLSVVLSLSKKEKADPRIEEEIEKLIQRVLE
ncbi:hypothetical protein ACIQY5_25575 [Peribacillus frigoritolerans]|uniref:hypothetical protein n=1 Tax=Peribacillus frigoritolerans TaxID=450367 RepID=UPI003830A0A2